MREIAGRLHKRLQRVGLEMHPDGGRIRHVMSLGRQKKRLNSWAENVLANGV